METALLSKCALVLDSDLTLVSLDGVRRERRAGISVDPGRVRSARVAAGLSLAQLARDDVSRTFLHFVEHGRSRPSKQVLDLIATRTGKPLSYFVPRSDATTEPTEELAAEMVGLANRLKRAYASQDLEPAEQQALTMLRLLLTQGAALALAVKARPRTSAKTRRRKNE